MIDNATQRRVGDGPTPEATAAELLQARSALYDVLAAAFDGDVAVLAAAIESGAFRELIESLPESDDSIHFEDGSVDEDALALAYDNLFVVPGPRYLPPFASGHVAGPDGPYESDSPFHAGGSLLGDPAASMVRLYDRAGFSPSRGEFPDHAAAQFEFLATLVRAEERSRRHGDENVVEAIRDLQDQTLARLEWIERVSDAIVDVDDTGVYAAVADIARTCVEVDRRDGFTAGGGHS